MKIIFMTVSQNYHVPILLRDVLSHLPKDEIKIVLSNRSSKLGVRKISQRYGLKYTVYKIAERIKYNLLVRRESRQDLNYFQRRYLLLSEVLERSRIKSRSMLNVNAPESFRDIQEFQPDLIISLYFDQIFHKPIIKLPTFRPINLHPSLLPAYAGSSPTFWVLANGESRTGITIHEIAEKIDSGRILYQDVVPIKPQDTQFTLYRRCTIKYIEPLLNFIEICRRGEKVSSQTVRDDVTPSYYSRITNADLNRFLSFGRKFI